MNRVQLNFTSVPDAYDYLNRLFEESKDKFILTNSDGSKIADPKTEMGVLYALSEFDEIYLVSDK